MKAGDESVAFHQKTKGFDMTCNETVAQKVHCDVGLKGDRYSRYLYLFSRFSPYSLLLNAVASF